MLKYYKYLIYVLLISILCLAFYRPFTRTYLHNKTAVKPLYVLKTGQGEETLVLIHGLSSAHNYWEPVIETFKSQFQIIAPDLLGFGQSPWPISKYDLNAQIRELDKILPSKPFILMGHSMGGLIAIELAKRYPEKVKQLILLAPPSLNSRKELKQILKKESTIESIMALDTFWAPLACYVHEVLGDESFYMLGPSVKSYIPFSLLKSAAMHNWPSYNKSLKKIVLKNRALDFNPRKDLNYHIILGENDRYSKNDLMKAKFKNLTLLPAGHNFLWEKKEETLSLISKLINKRDLLESSNQD